jgi:hypothetical protein
MRILLRLLPPHVPLFVAVILSLGTIRSHLRADVVFALNEAMLQFSTVPSRAVAPLLEVRAYAIAHLAMHEAIAAAARGSSAPEGRLDAQRAAAVTAAQTALAELVPAWTTSFAAVAERYLGAISDGADKSRGIAAGQVAAARVLQRRGQDGWRELILFHGPSGPVPDVSPGAANAVAGGDPSPRSPWLEAVPFTLRNAKQFQAAELTRIRHDGSVATDHSLQNSTLFEGVDRIAAGETMERFWLQRPVVAWNRIARQACVGQTVDLGGQARLLATLNVALADATLSALHWQHTIGSWRAVWAEMWQTLNGAPPKSTDIVARTTDGHFSELVSLEMQRVLIPPIPNYPSLSATTAGAAQAAITHFFKGAGPEFALPNLERGAMAETPSRVFADVTAAARESAFVASLDGRHSREACISGYRLGAAIGDFASKQIAKRR